MKRDIQTYEEYFAWQLVINDDRCQGVIAWDLLNGGLKSIGAKTVILTTGGGGPPGRRIEKSSPLAEGTPSPWPPVWRPPACTGKMCTPPASPSPPHLRSTR